MEIKLVITWEKLKANSLAFFCWLNVILGIYFVVESFKEFEPKAASIFLAYAILFFLGWLIPWSWKKVKGHRNMALTGQG